MTTVLKNVARIFDGLDNITHRSESLSTTVSADTLSNLIIASGEFMNLDGNSPIPCFKLRLIGVALLLLFLASTLSNSTLLCMLVSNKHSKSSKNTFVIALCVLNLIGTILELPFVIVSNLMCKWPFRHSGCVISAFIMFFVGVSSMYLMAVITVERFAFFYKPMVTRRMKIRTRVKIVAGCVSVALLWSTLPLLGWSRYSMEACKTSCAMEWMERSPSVTSYNMTMFIFVFFVPLSVIVGLNAKLIMLINEVYCKKRRSSECNESENISIDNNTINEETPNKDKDDFTNLTIKSIKITVILIIYIMIFVISWMPYAVVVLYSALVKPNAVEPMHSLLPAVFAKSSMFWSSLFYLLTNYIFTKRKGADNKLKAANHQRNRKPKIKSKPDLEMIDEIRPIVK